MAQVEEDTHMSGSLASAKMAGDLICELFPFLEMAQEADLLPPILLPLLLLVDTFEKSAWPEPMEAPPVGV